MGWRFPEFLPLSNNFRKDILINDTFHFELFKISTKGLTPSEVDLELKLEAEQFQIVMDKTVSEKCKMESKLGAETSQGTNLSLYIKSHSENPIQETLVKILAGSLTSGCWKETLRFGLINLGRLNRKESNNSTYDLRSSGLRTNEDK